MDSEHARRFSPIARAPCQSAAHQHFLEPGGGRRQIFIRPIDCSFGCCSILIDEVEIGRVDDIAAHQHRGALDRVLQLADIPGPCMADEARRGIRGEPLGAAGPREKVLGERNDVGDTLSQRWQVDRHHMQSIEQVFSEAALAHALL